MDGSAEGLAPFEEPVLVTGAGGFLGGHIARDLALAGFRVRGFVRARPRVAHNDPPIEWFVGDLRNPCHREHSVRNVRAVVHTAGWVSLGPDPRGDARAVNVEATRGLLDSAEAVGVERFVLTSTLWTVAAGSPSAPAIEECAWNLERIWSPYCETKREAERLVLSRSRPNFATVALCPGLVVGPRDVGPTSTRVFLGMAQRQVLMLPGGGIPVVDASVVALAHRRALTLAEPGRRYIVAGPYLSYLEMAELVARITGRPRHLRRLPDLIENPACLLAGRLDRWTRGRLSHVDLSAAAVAGAFLRLHVSGARADALFGLHHPPPIRSIYQALEDHLSSGRAPWLSLSKPEV